jgi:hypothetical protein
MADNHKNLAISAVATAPSPDTSGTSLVVTGGHGTRFPSVPFNATVWPANAQPTPANAEIVRVTAISTDTLTIVRAQEGTTARAIIVTDQIAATITAKTFTDIETSSRTKVTQASHGFVAEEVIYHTGTAWDEAKADSISTAHAVGVVESVIDTDTFIVVFSGQITLTGKALNSTYYLSDATEGLLALSPPTAVTSYVVPVLKTTSATTGYVEIGAPMSCAKIAITDIDKLDLITIPGNPQQRLTFGTHFQNHTITEFGFTIAGGATTTQGSAANALGVYNIGTGTTSGTGSVFAWVATAAGTMDQIGLGPIVIKARVYINALSTSAQKYVFRLGLGNTNTASDYGNGVWFEYEGDTLTSWRMCSNTNSGTATKTNGTSAVVALGWQRLEIRINAAGTAADFYVNDALIGTLTTTLPNVPSRQLGPVFSVNRTVGANNILFNFDYYFMTVDLTTSL